MLFTNLAVTLLALSGVSAAPAPAPPSKVGVVDEGTPPSTADKALYDLVSWPEPPANFSSSSYSQESSTFIDKRTNEKRDWNNANDREFVKRWLIDEYNHFLGYIDPWGFDWNNAMYALLSNCHNRFHDLNFACYNTKHVHFWTTDWWYFQIGGVQNRNCAVFRARSEMNRFGQGGWAMWGAFGAKNGGAVDRTSDRQIVIRQVAW
jgi:hypothetical protein